MGQSAAARAAGRFKQLCCLGLGAQTVMPALIDTLHALIPFYSAKFTFADGGGDLISLYSENPEDMRLLPVYLQEFHGTRDRELPGCCFLDAMETQFGVHVSETAMGIELATFHRRDFYNTFLRPSGEDRFMRLVVRDEGRGLGAITLYREPGQPEFSRQDKLQLAALEEFFVQALVVQDVDDIPLAEGTRSGVIIADADGYPLYFSSEGRRLLFLATHAQMTPETTFGHSPKLPPPLVKLCRNMADATDEKSDAQAPSYQHRNAWGGFKFRGHRMEAESGTRPIIAVTISHQEPVPVKLLRRVGEMALSPRQAEVCLLMARGLLLEEIAQQLGISRHTANEHSRWVYHRLDVHSRSELLGKLLSG